MTFKLLVLDDEPWQLSWTEDLAHPFGGVCYFASTYDDAVKQFDALSPEVAIVDMRIGDVLEPPKGATLEAADPDWVGLRFLRFVRVERKAKTTLFVYTALDRAQLQTIVESSYQARFFTKFESGEFAEALTELFRRISSGGRR